MGTVGDQCDRGVRQQLPVVRTVADREHARRVDAGPRGVGQHPVPLRQAVRADGDAVPAEVAARGPRVGVTAHAGQHARDDVFLEPEDAEREHRCRRDDLVEVGGARPFTERAEV